MHLAFQIPKTYVNEKSPMNDSLRPASFAQEGSSEYNSAQI